MGVWGVKLNGVYLSGGTDDPNLSAPACEDIETIIAGCLTEPPDGLGLPARRTEDITYTQRDGVKHFSDWWEPRFVTLQAVISGDDCVDCTDAREKVMLLMQAWTRTCCDTELIIYPPCEPKDCSLPIPGEEAVRTNLVTNPSIEVAITGWAAVVNSTVVRDTTEFLYGVASAKMTSSAAGAESSFASPAGTSGFAVTEGTTYAASVYVKAPVVTRTAQLELDWYDAAGVSLGTMGEASLLLSPTWERLEVVEIAPIDAAFVRLRVSLLAPAAAGEVVFADGFLLEQAGTVEAYFDGSTTDVNPEPAIGSTQCNYAWTGTAHASTSTSTCQTYVSNCTCLDRILTGPYAIVGRPRVAEVQWLKSKKQIARVLLRFDSVDHRMTLTDPCGTVGYSECVDIVPGSEIFTFCLSDGLCFNNPETADTFCFNQPAADGQSISPTDINVCGTEKVYPTIVLQPELVDPRVESLTTGEWIGFDGKVSAYPVEINTEDGTAFQNGVSVTHLLRGSLFMSMDPGDHQLRLLVGGEFTESTGLASICWRPTVISA